MQNAGARVLVIDADLGLADMNIAFGVRPKFTMQDVADGRVSVADALIVSNYGVKLLPAYSGSFDLANLDPQRRYALMQALEGLPDAFDVVLIDTGAGIGATAMSFAAAATEIIVVTTRDMAAIADAYATMKVLSQRFGVTRVRLLVNMIETATDAQVVYETLEQLARRFLQLRVERLGYVCRDNEVSRAWRRGTPFAIERPDAPASHCVRVLASSLYRSSTPVITGGVQLFWRRLSAAAAVIS